MDVDSSMVPEADHDPAVQNHSTVSSAAGVDRDQLRDQPQDDGGTSPQSLSSPQQQQTTVQMQQSTVVGPRLAPSYSVVNAIIEKKEDGPGPRCGHTLTAVGSVGEEGSPGYLGPRLILFGGATALEGNAAASGTPSSAGSAGISTFFFLLNYVLFNC